MSQTIPKWTEERTSTLESMVEEGVTVTTALVKELADTLGTTTRSVASKLRQLNYDVETAAATKSFSDEEETEISNFLEANDGVYTYAEIASAVCGGKFSAKQVQGKILSMELTDQVKKAEKVESVKTYSDAEEQQLLSLLSQDAYIEDIAEAMNRSINQIRGKVLSLSRTNPGINFPKQKSYAESKVDPLESLGNVAEMTVAEIADAIEKTERGVKTMLTRRGIDVADYKGKAKADKKAEAKAAE